MKKNENIALVIGASALPIIVIAFVCLASTYSKKVMAGIETQRGTTGNTNLKARSTNVNLPPGNSNQSVSRVQTDRNPIAILETDLGVIQIELLKNESPATVENFILLASRGFYDGVIFHRVITGFMIQGGDPTGKGTGGESATGEPLANEINRDSLLYQTGYKRGIVAMANKDGDPTTGSSQFFIMHQDYLHLPRSYTIFGRVIEGIDVVDKIATAPTKPSVNGENSSPFDPVKMIRVVIQ